MSDFETFSAITASLALVISLISYLKSRKALSGSMEMSLNNTIATAESRVSEMGLKMEPLLTNKNRTKAEDDLLEAYRKHLKAAIESNLNAYNEACAKYLDRKVDRKRFKETYFKDILNLMDRKSLRKYFQSSDDYSAIVKVYKLWEKDQIK